VVTESLPRGRPYSEVKRVVSVNIVYFDVGCGSDYVYFGRNEFRGIHTQDVLTLNEDQKRLFGCADVAELFPEYYILRINNFNDVARDGLDQWIYFLKNEDIPGSFNARGLQEAKEMLDVMKLSDDDRKAYEAFQNDLHQQASMYQESFGKLAEARQMLEEERCQKEEAQREREEERCQKEEAQRQKEEAQRQKEEAQRQREEAQREKEELALAALEALLAAGVPEAEARKKLGL